MKRFKKRKSFSKRKPEKRKFKKSALRNPNRGPSRALEFFWLAFRAEQARRRGMKTTEIPAEEPVGATERREPLRGAALKRTIEPSPEARADFKRTPFVRERFELRPASVERLRSTPWSFGFGAFSEIVYHDNNYCRKRKDGTLEEWPDTIQRVVNGVMSIRKDWYVRHRIRWDDGRWQEFAEEMALAFLRLECGPPGRGYQFCGTDYMYERGAFCLTNCAATDLRAEHLDADFGWAADALLCGSGVGFECLRDDSLKMMLSLPSGTCCTYSVPDSREGWVESIELLIGSYMGKSGRVDFFYDEIRPEGTPIGGFGGVCPGPEPLRKLHARMRESLDRFCRGEISSLRLKADTANQIGDCVVAGGCRRSAEILIGDPDDDEFLDLKDYSKNPDRDPDRGGWGGLSNNSPRLTLPRHFEAIPTKIAPRARVNGEPGILNFVSTQKFARFGRLKPDPATLYQPCGELPLVPKEICTLSENYPSRAPDAKKIVRNVEITGFYTSTVSLLPTHRQDTNAIIAKNRRIGVGMSGVADWQAKTSVAEVTRVLRRAYEALVSENERLAAEAGVPPAIRVSCCKPSGTVSLLAGVSPGGHFAMGEFYVRRKRVSTFSPYRQLLDAAGYPFEVAEGDNTLAYEFPQAQAGVRTQAQAGMFEQALQLCMLQREWADNAVSFTIDFDPVREGPGLGNLLAQIAPMTKSVSVLPRRCEQYRLPPYEEIPEREYRLRLKMVRPIDWRGYSATGSDEADKFCSGPVCEVRPKEKP